MKHMLRYAAFTCMILMLLYLVPSPALTEALDASQVTPIPIDAEKSYPVDDKYYISDMEYLDPTLHVKIEKDRYLESDMWIVRVKIADPCQLRTAMAGIYRNNFSKKVSTMAKRQNAVLAINGDYYAYSKRGVILKQGRLFRNRLNGKYDILMIDDQGDFYPMINARTEEFKPVFDSFGGAWKDGGRLINVLTFGPVLIMDGELAHDNFTRPDKSHDVYAQRMVIAQDGPLSYLCICCEGPESANSRGLTINEMGDYVLTLNCQTAYNLDGGSSSCIVFHDEKINSLDTGKDRAVSDIVYFGSALAP